MRTDTHTTVAVHRTDKARAEKVKGDDETWTEFIRRAAELREEAREN
jgi:hypothetical protein